MKKIDELLEKIADYEYRDAAFADMIEALDDAIEAAIKEAYENGYCVGYAEAKKMASDEQAPI